MNASKVFINKLQLNTFKVNERAQLKIYFTLSKPALELSKGEFNYQNEQSQNISLPLIAIDKGIFLPELKENMSYQGQIKLNFQRGEQINQKIGFTLMPWLNEFKIYFSPMLNAMKFKGYIGLKVNSDEENEIDHFEINSNLISGQQSLASTNAEAYFKNIKPEAVDTLNIRRYDNNGKKYQAQLLIYIPPLQMESKKINQPDLGYSKFMDSTSLQETYHLPITKNILAQQSTWQIHHQETASLANTPMLAVKSVTSADASQYIAKHDLTQQNNYLDYSEARAQGFQAGPNTKVVWKKSHQGNRILSHAGSMSQTRQVQTESINISAPEINYQYGNRTSTYTGNSLTHTRINSTEITNNEQSTINSLKESAPVSQLSINQSTEAYDSQSFNVENFTSYANQLTLSGPMFVDADSFDISEGSSILNNLQQEQQRYNQCLNQDNNDYDIFVATVYAESANSSEVAWKAVGSVMVNRVGKGYWKKSKTPGAVASQKGQFDGYGTILYIKALGAIKIKKLNQMTKLTEIYAALKEVYNGAVTTEANFYYSPKGYPANKIPSFIHPWVKEIKVPEISSTDNFIFYYDPNNGERPK